MPRTHQTLPRLYVSSDLAQAGEGGRFALDKDQSNYLAAVLRKRVGDEVVVFNGRDGAWLARLVQDSKRAVVLEPVEQVARQPAPAGLWYGFAPLKTARLDYMVQKATEMGAGVVQPVLTRYTQVSRINLDKIRANVVEAAEQCEVLTVPEVAPEVPLDRLLAEWPQRHGDRRLILADEGEASASPLSALQSVVGRPLGLLVGPEGGFSPEERASLRACDFVLPVSLGPRILRADTAAVAALAVIQASIGDWR